MEEVVLVIHLFLALAIIGLVLIQRSEGGGLGIGGGGGGMGNLATARGTANLLTRVTGICAAAFFCTSLILGIMAGHDSTNKQGLLDSLNPDMIVRDENGAPITPATDDVIPQESEQAPETAPDAPSAPIAE